MPRILRISAALALLLAATAFAQEKKDPLQGFLVPPEKIFEEITKGITRHYSLNETQQEFARQMVSDYGRKFMEKHADELKSLQMEGMKIAFTGGKPDSATIRDLAGRVRALLSDSREMFEKGGAEFHEILDDDQKARHAIELKQFKMILDVADLELEKMVATGALPGPDQNRGGKPDPNKPASDNTGGSRRFSGKGFVEQNWEAYTKLFGAHYRFDAEQSRKAGEMLELAKKDAADYRKTNEARLKELAEEYKRVTELAKDKNLSADMKVKTAEDLKALSAAADEFEAPLHVMFAKLKEALDALPTAEQKSKSGAFPLRNLGKKN